MICPICGNDMVKVDYLSIVMDGNKVWQCPTNIEHRFWRNMRQGNVLFQHPKASLTNFDAIKGWSYTTTPLIYAEMDEKTFASYIL